MEHQLRVTYQHVSALNPVLIQVLPRFLIKKQTFPEVPRKFVCGFWAHEKYWLITMDLES